MWGVSFTDSSNGIVTHDLREAHFLADRIAVFDNGRILQVSPREEVFKRPVSRRVAQLTGVGNIWSGTVVRAGPNEVIADVAGARFTGTAQAPLSEGEKVDVIVRAERINLLRDAPRPANGAPNVFETEIVFKFAYGATHTLQLRPSVGPEMEVEIASRPYEVLGLGSRHSVTARIEPEDVHVVRAAT